MPRVDLKHVELSLEQRDRGQETRSLQSVAIQTGGRHVGGDNQGHALAQQFLEQPAEQHRVGDVGDLEFIDAPQARPPRHPARQQAQRILSVL